MQELFIKKTDMMKTLSFLLPALSIIILASCSSTRETTTENRQLTATPNTQQYEEYQERMQNQSERTGLSYEDVQKINGYAERKAEMVCKMEKLSKSAEMALSDVAQKEHKEAIVSLDQQLTALSKEIDTYCDTEAKQKYFYQALKQYSKNCY